MTTNASVINPYQKFYAEDGITPLSGGSIAVYENGTTTLLAIYSDNGMTVPQDNPYNLDAGGAINGDIHFEGFATITPFDGPDGTGAEMPSFDDVSCFDQSNPFGLWDATVTYTDDRSASNIVQSPVDENYYVSIQNGNLNHEPSVSPSWWRTFITGDQQTFTSSDTWTKIAGANWVFVELWGAGAGGGAGLNSAAAENRGGGGGGGGGAYTAKLYKASDLAATVAVTIGAGGAGGATAAGSAGGTTSFGSHLLAYGGEGGTVGDNSGNVATGGQPGGSLTAGASLSGSTYGTADDTRFGAAGNSGGTNAVVALAGLRSLEGGPGGGGGGGLNAGGTATAGAAGGSQAQAASLTGGGGAGGAATGANGSAGAAFQGGGGGGAGNAGGVGGAGGRAGGGGGGGAGTTGAGSPPGGNGGAGGDGYAKISSW